MLRNTLRASFRVFSLVTAATLVACGGGSSSNNNANPLEILQRAVDNAKPRLEVKARRVGGATYQVPLEVTNDRQVSLALRWLVDFADARKGTPMMKALASEIMDAYQGQGNAIRKRDEVHKMAQANKAFAHFRW
jgi:small subunit ribosomal protein S7